MRDPNKTVIYRSNYGLPLSRYDRFINKLWYYVAEENKLWAKVIYYPMSFVESMYYRVKVRLEEKSE